MKIQNPITTAEAARRLDIDPANVRSLCVRSRLKAEKFGRDWFICPVSVESYASTRRRGRPTGWRKKKD